MIKPYSGASVIVLLRLEHLMLKDKEGDQNLFGLMIVLIKSSLIELFRALIINARKERYVHK